MESKDNRSINKRKMMKQLKRKTQPQNTSSSGIADVADSSDDRFVHGGGWRAMQQDRCYDLDELDVLDEINDVQQAQMLAGDFTAMSQIPTAIGGHFKFASEKNWDAANDADTELLKNTEAGEYFTLNLKLLNAGLKTLPFHKRMDLPSSMFTNQEIATMEKVAEEAEKTYQHILHGNDIANPIINILKGSGSAKSNKTENKAAAVDEVTSATENLNVAINATSPAPTGNTNDIQDWLDNVLEEGN